MNRDGLTCGRTDVPLNCNGHSQINQVAIALETCFPDRRFQPCHSSLIRSVESCRIIARVLASRCEAPAEYADLDEQDWGTWEGRPWVDVLNDIRAQIWPTDGENPEYYLQRSARALRAILESATALPLVVCHGGTFHALSQLLGTTTKQLPNAAAYYFEPNVQDFKHFEVTDRGLVHRSPFIT